MKPQATTALLAALALLAPLVLIPAPAEAGTTRVLAITAATAKPSVAWKTFDSNPPKVFDFNGDGRLEIVAQNDNNWVYVFDSKTGTMLAEVTTSLPGGWGARSFNGPEAAIMAGGTSPRLIVANSAAYIASFRLDVGASTTSKFVFHKEWEKRMNICHGDPGMDAKPVLADLDRDGRLEILAMTEENGLYALRMDGSLYWRTCMGGGNADPAVVDLNGDGLPEVVAVSDGGIVAALNGRTGGWMWSFNARSKFNLGSASIPVGPGIGQLDGVGGPDIVVGARDIHDTSNYDNNHAMLIALSSSGQLLWNRQDPNGNPLTYTHPIVVDADRNGVNEVYWADWNTIGHKGGVPPEDSWKVTGPANFYRFDNRGNQVWKQTIPTWWQNKDVPLADVDGDGVQEMLANGPNSSGQDGIWYLDTRNGARETHVSTYPWKVARAPIIADLWNTGTMQWVVQVGPQTSTAGGPAILVYDTGQRYSSAWPHLPYPGSGTAPPPTSPPPTPPPPTGEFDASFSAVRGNEWWVQATVSSTGESLAKVEVSLNGGSWKPLTKQSWGGWAASYHMPQGTVVQLKATGTGGGTETSACYKWIPPSNADASTVACGTSPPPPTPPPPGDFDASFSGVRGNEWWVQTFVSSTGESLAKVEVSLNGGSWKPLAKQSWGGWAASYHIVQGTVVQFRATGSGGGTDMSACYKWIPPSNTDASTVSCGTAPPPGSFDASFSTVRGNEWWVQANVGASGGTLAKVEVRLNGGSWQPLAKQSWGAWAASYHMPQGTVVQLKATATDGASDLSSCYKWIPPSNADASTVACGS